ncbi:MAG TPA: TonB-dependent receptor, partial [Longimicrobiales bacterium]
TVSNITVRLETDALRLDELIVIGYGEERRRNIAGAVASLRPETVEEIPVTSVNQVLQGRLAGVQVVQNSGTPGAAMTVRVRGSSSISGGNEPLYVIDGVPMTQGNFSSLNMSFGGQGIDAISDLNPSEIESIEILKDASAAAIFGSRASNGVVLITTKRGISNRAEVSIGGYYGWQSDWRRIDLLDADEYMAVYNEGMTAAFGPASLDGYDDWLGYVGQGDYWWNDAIGPVAPGTNTNWLDEVMQTAPIRSMEASVRGGTDQVRYFVSGTALNQDGIVQPMGYQRLNGRVNLDYNPFQRLTVGTNVSLARSITDRARSDNTIYSPWANAIANAPIFTVFQSDGSYTETTYLNPVGMAREAEAEERGTRIIGNAFAQYQLLDWLSLRGSVGLDHLNMRSRSYDSPTFGPWASSGGSGQSGNTYANKVTYEGTANFNRTVAEGHDVSGVVGASMEDNVDEFSYVQGTQFPTEYFKYITSAATIQDGSSTRADWGLTSFFGRLTYTFQERVTTTFNIRRDGSSRFGAANRYGTFPSASILWRIGDESFMQGQNIFSNLALRASYGVTGNQQSLGNFASRGLFGGGANYDDLPGIAPSQLANPELRWEKTTQLNLGTDFSVLNDRVGITFDWYDKKTDDLLVARPVPRTTGFTSIWSNVGSMENRGFEVAANLFIVPAAGPQAFSWSTTVNVARNRNEVTALYNDQPINSGFANRVEVGKPLGFFYGHRMVGIFQSDAEICRTLSGETATQRNQRCAAAGLAYQASGTAPGDVRFDDIDGNGVINDDDRTDIGSPWPDWEGGITNNLAFMGVDVSAFVQFSFGNEIYNANRIYTDQYGSFFDNHTTRALDRWTPTNPSTTEPRAIWGDPNNNTRDSSRFIEDGSFWRLKNLVVGYTLPSSFAERLGYRSARIYFQGQNLFTQTDYSGFDPEVNFSGQSSIARGTDFYTLPQSRTITFGFNLGF